MVFIDIIILLFWRYLHVNLKFHWYSMAFVSSALIKIPTQSAWNWLLGGARNVWTVGYPLWGQLQIRFFYNSVGFKETPSLCSTSFQISILVFLSYILHSCVGEIRISLWIFHKDSALYNLRFVIIFKTMTCCFLLAPYVIQTFLLFIPLFVGFWPLY